MRIIVTGGAGLIGRHLCKKLIDEGNEVLVIDTGIAISRIPPAKHNFVCDILYESELRSIFASFGPQVVYHLAAVLGVKNSEDNPQKTYDVNVVGTVNVLNCCVDFGVEHLIFASSSEVYGEPIDEVITESSHTRGKNVYSWSKLASEVIIKTRCISANLNFTIVRLFNCYGPKQVAQFVIPKFINKVLNRESPIIYGDGGQVRTFCYVSDTVEALSRCKDYAACRNETINIGGDWSYTIVELGAMLLEVSGLHNSIELEFINKFYDTDRSAEREIYNRVSDMSRMREWLEFTPKVTLEDGLRKTLLEGMCPDHWS